MHRLRLVLQLLTDREREILAFLAKNPSKSAFEISIELRITQSTVYKALNRMAREGLVKPQRIGGSEGWSIVSQKEFKEIFVKAIDGLMDEIYK